jgi:hypothetical protein
MYTVGVVSSVLHTFHRSDTHFLRRCSVLSHSYTHTHTHTHTHIHVHARLCSATGLGDTLVMKHLIGSLKLSNLQRAGEAERAETAIRRAEVLTLATVLTSVTQTSVWHHFAPAAAITCRRRITFHSIFTIFYTSKVQIHSNWISMRYV